VVINTRAESELELRFIPNKLRRARRNHRRGVTVLAFQDEPDVMVARGFLLNLTAPVNPTW